MKFKIWAKAMRLPFLTATAVPVILGGSVAWYISGMFNWFNFMLTMVGIACLHIGTNLMNDYFDHKSGNDEANSTPTPFSGGSRVIQDGLIPAEQILFASVLFFVLGSLIGMFLVWKLQSSTILLLGIFGVLCGVFYTAAPLKLGYRSSGELLVGLCFGPLTAVGSYYVQTDKIFLIPLLASIPVGILILLVLYINEFPDYNADKSVHKKTIIVILGKEKGIKLYHILLGSVYLYTIMCVVFHLLPIYTLLILLTLPLAFKAYRISRIHFDKVEELLPVNAATIQLHLSIGLLLSAGFILDKIF